MSQDFTQDFMTSRRNYEDGTTRLGQKGRLWYDSLTNTIRIGDGTPGGRVIGGGGGGGGSIEIRDEGILITPAANSVNFEGNGVTVTDEGAGAVTVNITTQTQSLVFDGGFPSSDYSTGPVFDAGGVT